MYASGKVIGGLGVSGDSACADHVIAYRMRKNAGLDGIPKGVGFNGTDNIDYPAGHADAIWVPAPALLSARYRTGKHLITAD